MKIGMPVLFEYDSVCENVKLAKELNVDFIEMNLNMAYCREALEGKEDLHKLFNENNLDMTLHFYDETDFATYVEVIDAYLGLLEKYVKLGAKYNLKKVNIHLNCGPVVTISGVKNYIYEKEGEDFKKRITRALNKALDILSPYGIDLVIENVNYGKEIPYLKDVYRFLKAEGYNFNLDVGHDDNSGYFVTKLDKEIDLGFKEFHVHDANGKTDHLCLGDGNVDLKYYKSLAEKNDAYVLLEVKSSDDLRKSVPYFKNL